MTLLVVGLVYLGYGLVWAACMGIPDRSPRKLSWLYSLTRYTTNLLCWPLCGLVYMLQKAKR